MMRAPKSNRPPGYTIPLKSESPSLKFIFDLFGKENILLFDLFSEALDRLKPDGTQKTTQEMYEDDTLGRHRNRSRGLA